MQKLALLIHAFTYESIANKITTCFLATCNLAIIEVPGKMRTDVIEAIEVGSPTSTTGDLRLYHHLRKGVDLSVTCFGRRRDLSLF